MFSHIAKNPLEAETVGQRRERKSKESEGSVLSARSSLSARDAESLRNSSKFNVFGAWQKGSTTTITGPEKPLRITVTKTVDVSSYEIPGFDYLPSPAWNCSGQRPASRNDWESSAFPSPGWNTSRKSPSFRAVDLLKNVDDELGRNTASSEPSPVRAIDTNRDSGIGSIDLISPAELDAPVKEPIAAENRRTAGSVRSRMSSSVSTRSTRSTTASETISMPMSITEEIIESDTSRSSSGKESRDEMVSDLSSAASSVVPQHDRLYSKAPASTPIVAAGTGPAGDSIHEALSQEKPEQTVLIPNHRTTYPTILRLMEVASNQVLCQRLNETWDGIDLDLRRHISFDQQLWAMNALKRLEDSQPSGNVLDNDETDHSSFDANESMQKLNICNVGAESWAQAAANPNSTIHCLSPSSHFDFSSSQWMPLRNMDANTWVDVPALPVENTSIDLVWSRSLPLHLRSTDWPTFMRDCVRVLQPGGSLELTVLDPMPRNAGPLLQRWTTTHLILELEKRFLITRPAMLIPFWLEDVSELTQPEVKTIEFPAITATEIHHSTPISVAMVDCHIQLNGSPPGGESDVEQLRTTVGRYFYQSLYRDLVTESRPRTSANTKMESSRDNVRNWWWKDPAIVKECKEYGTVFDIVTYTCLRKDSV